MSNREVNSSFSDLTPIDNADPGGTYSEALSYAMENNRIKNIAITGPYGSGKSSIIKTYEKQNQYKFLNISLACFKEEKDDSVDINIIERSILQQMLYGADANNLPYSRFKRIKTPKNSIYKSLLFVIWMIIATFLYQHRSELPNVETFSLYWFTLCILVTFVVSALVVTFSELYKSTSGLSLKKLSLKDIEVGHNDESETSILNHHLDEIIYFFQETGYDAVIIEDLDRFGNPEIFVKLREINKLVNDNESTSGIIKFIYALKDDMFVHKNRAKFFDFIIPVIPIINSSNSLDKIMELLDKNNFLAVIDKQFLREVSLYINDMRLIINIVNEFIIYYGRLKTNGLDVTKLFAMMVYKNVYPSDFEKLHNGEGALFEVCTSKVDYLKKSKQQLKDKINEINAFIENANNEKVRNIQELIDIYIANIIKQNNQNQAVIGIVYNNQHIPFSQFTSFDKFKPLISEKTLQLATNLNQRTHRVQINKSFSQIEDEINPGETFLERKKNIENKVEFNKTSLQQNIKEFEEDRLKLSHKQLYQLIENRDVVLDSIIKKNNLTDSDLLMYLIKNGYLDDNYYHYISNFHEGRLTKNDRDFLLTIRSFKHPQPNQKIDTPEEVCANMRDEDFGHKYVLNVTLIDFLLENNSDASNKIKATLNYISQNFNKTVEFFTAFINSGKNLNKLTRELSYEWNDFAIAVISNKNEIELISSVFEAVDNKFIVDNMNKDNKLSEYLSTSGHFYLSYFQTPENYKILLELNVQFHDLSLVEENYDLLEYIHIHSLYSLTPKNILCILHHFSKKQTQKTLDPEIANYTSILSHGSSYLKEYIEKNIVEYIENVLLKLSENSKENETAIKTLLNIKEIDDSLKEKIISIQEHIFKIFFGLPEQLWKFLMLEEKVVISWKNISIYMKYEDYDEEVITNILQREHVIKHLSKNKFTSKELGDDESKFLSKFISTNNGLDDSVYCALIGSLPYWYHSYPEKISDEKLICLTSQRVVRLTDESYSYSENDIQLTSLLISKNFTEYLADKEKYPIEDDVRELLLKSELSNKNKITICFDVTPTGAINNKQLSTLVANLLVSSNIDYSQLDNTVISEAIINAKLVSNSIKILMKVISLWSESEVMDLLSKLPKPYSDISSYAKRPKLANNKLNIEFSEFLQSQGFISQYKEDKKFIRIITFKSATH